MATRRHFSATTLDIPATGDLDIAALRETGEIVAASLGQERARGLSRGGAAIGMDEAI